jgi:hypothetical protein
MNSSDFFLQPKFHVHPQAQTYGAPSGAVPVSGVWDT